MKLMKLTHTYLTGTFLRCEFVPLNREIRLYEYTLGVLIKVR